MHRCPFIEKYQEYIRRDAINDDDLSFDLRMNHDRCIAACICPLYGDYSECYRPIEILNRFGLVYETLVSGELNLSLLSDPGFHIRADGGSIARLYDDRHQIDYYESSEIFFEDVTRSMRQKQLRTRRNRPRQHPSSSGDGAARALPS